MSGIIDARLHAFDIDSDELKPEHKRWLRGQVVPILRHGGSVTLVGEASRSGNAAYNDRLSERRAVAVLHFLESESQGPCRARTAQAPLRGEGEAPARKAGQKDDTEDQFYRAVRIKAWHHQIPPEVPNPRPPKAATTTVKRVASRKWVNTKIKNAPGPGEPAGTFFDAFKAQQNQTMRADFRTYVNVPSDWVVVEVRRTFSNLDDDPNLTWIGLDVAYKWGPQRPNAVIHYIYEASSRTSPFHPKTINSTRLVRQVAVSEIQDVVEGPDERISGNVDSNWKNQAPASPGGGISSVMKRKGLEWIRGKTGE